MHPAGARIDHQRQLVGVGILELGEAAVLEQQLGQRVVLGQLGEHILVGRGLAGGGLLDHRQAELAEQDFAELLGRTEVEGLAGELMRLLLEAVQATTEFLGMLGQQEVVDQHAGALHLEQHLQHRQLDFAIELFQPWLGASWLDRVWCRRRVMSASSAAYSMARSTATSAKPICLAPLPHTSV